MQIVWINDHVKVPKDKPIVLINDLILSRRRDLSHIVTETDANIEIDGVLPNPST